MRTLLKYKRHSAPRGFTLVELLVVVSIIGLIATVVSYNLESARMKARDTKRMQDVESIVQAMFLYESITGRPMADGSGCGYQGNGWGHLHIDTNTPFTGYAPSYPKSIMTCFIEAGVFANPVFDPNETVPAHTSSPTAGFTYHVSWRDIPIGFAVGPECIRGKTRYVYAKLEGRAQSSSATDSTCHIDHDVNHGMNYFKKID